MGLEMTGRLARRLELDVARRRLLILDFRGAGAPRSTMDEVASALAENGERKKMVLRLERPEPGRDEGLCGLARTWPKDCPEPPLS